MIKVERYKLSVLAVISVLLLSCSNSGSCSTCNNGSSNQGSNGDVTSIKVTSPYLIPSLANESSFGFVVVRNASESTVRNIHYSIANPIGGGAKVIIDSLSAKQCSELSATASCKLKLTVPAGSAGGAFNLSLNNSDTATSKQSSATTASSQLIGVQPTQYTSLSGANGVVGYYYPTVLNGVQYLVFVGTVTSSAVGSFNSVQLVTGTSNQPLPNISNLSDNLGAGMPALGKGSSFSLLVPVQTSIATQNFKIQLSTIASDGSVSNVQTGTASYSLTTVANQGIAVLYPAALNLSSSNPSQEFIVGNIGDVQLSNVSMSGNGVTVSGLNSTIPPASNSGAVITLTGTQAPNSITVSVNNGNGEQSQSVPVNNNPTPSPAPTPTPSPSPAPGPSPTPTPTAGLALTLTPNNNFVNTSAGSVSATRILTLTNSGNSTENGFILHLPSGFIGTSASGQSVTPCTISTGSGSATVSLGTDLTTSSTSCDVLVSYTSHAVVSNTPATITVDYNYNGGQAAPQANVGVNYQVTLSTAILSWSPSGTPTLIQFNISNNGVDIDSQQFVITNTGDADATSVDLSSDSNYFSFNQAQTTGGSVCNLTSGTIAGGGGICNIKVDFGPTLAVGPVINATLTASYTYAGNTGGTQTATNDVQGNISAAFGVDVASITGVTGTGTSGDPYSLVAGDSGSITIMYSNYGNSSIAGFTTTAAALPAGWTLSTHGCNNAALTTTSGGAYTCSDIYTLSNPSAASGDYNMLTNVTAMWTGNTTATQISGSPDIYYAFTAPPSANIAVSATPSSWDNSQTGGAESNPLLLHYIGNNLPQAFIEITYTNTGNGDANNFTTSYSPLPNGWTIRIAGCNGVTLTAAGGGSSSCTDQYRFTAPQDIHATGTEFNNGSVLVSWNDGTPHTNQVFTLPAGTSGFGGYNTNNIIYNAIYLDMFVSASQIDGQISSSPSGNDAITKADALCASDGNKPSTPGVDYKALLVAKASSPTTADSRYVCTTQACSAGESYNWVLQPNLRYASYSNYEQIVGKTNSKAIFDPAATLGPIIAASGTNAWTGLANTSTGSTYGYYDWMTAYSGYTQGTIGGNIGGNCNNWTSNASLNWSDPLTYGSMGSSWNTNYGLFGGSGDGCDTSYPLYCVQQP